MARVQGTQFRAEPWVFHCGIGPSRGAGGGPGVLEPSPALGSRGKVTSGTQDRCKSVTPSKTEDCQQG